MRIRLPRTIALWQLVGVLLILANIAYYAKNFLGWILTLGFFLFVPGYLLLNTIKHQITSRGELVSLSLGFSVFLLMAGGLVLNATHVLGVARPLTTLNSFITLDILTLLLMTLNRKKKLRATINDRWPGAEYVAITLLLTLLPLLAIGGAIRLNNGASNILTMTLFFAITVLFMVLVWRKNLRNLYPYAVLMAGLAVLLTTSLRGWGVTGHDIQHEFAVFQITSQHGYWSTADPQGDPYNACLSITLLPTMIAKLTTITPPYVYKAVFQLLFAFGLLPIFFFIKRMSNSTNALIASLIFISFPPFLNDLPFLNRQEVAFIFFSLLLLVSFTSMARRPKTIITSVLLLGLIFSHYSSGYVTLGLLLLAWIISKLASYRHRYQKPYLVPALSLPIIIVSLLFTFLWNAQITKTSGGLQQTITETLKSLEGNSSEQASGVSYSLFSPPTQSPVVTLNKYAGKNADQLVYVAPVNLPTTQLGSAVSHVIKVSTFNSVIRAFSAKILQVLLLVGLVILFIRQRKSSSERNMLFFSLNVAGFILLVLITLLPELSVDYSVTRLFQQTLILSGLLIVTGAEFIFSALRKYKIYVTALFFGLLFLDLSGFVPQALGGYPPQLALNNSGIYYDIYYHRNGEIVATKWLSGKDKGYDVAADSYASTRFQGYPFEKEYPLNPVLVGDDATYLYQDYTNSKHDLYASFLSGNVLEYEYSSPIKNNNLVYVNQSSKIYRK